MANDNEDKEALGKLKSVASFLVAVLILLALGKFIFGLININNCPADNKIPEFMVESSSVEFFFDIYVWFFANFALNLDKKPRVVALICEHLTVLVIETTYMAKQYYYLHDGCNGVENCCAQIILEFALGTVVTEWILVLIGFCFCIFYLIRRNMNNKNTKIRRF